jgi:outer membrane biosynthesis protein TonB
MPSDKREPGFDAAPPGGGRGAADALPAPVSAPVPGADSRAGSGNGEMPRAEARAADEAGSVPAAGRARGGVALSLMLHVAVAWAVFFGGDSVRELPSFLDEPVEVVLVDFPAAEEEAPEQVEQEEEQVPKEEVPEEQETEEEADTAPPPPLPPPPLPDSEQAETEPPAAEEPEEEKTETAEPEAAAPPEPAAPPQATPRVLIPVTEFAEEDSGNAERPGEIGLREGVEETPEAESETEAEAAVAPPGEGTGETAGEEPGEGPDGDRNPVAADGEEIANPVDDATTREEVEVAQDGAPQDGAPQEAPAQTETETETGTGTGTETETGTDGGTEVAALNDPVAPGETETAAEVEANADSAGELDVLGTPGEGPGAIAATGSGLPPAGTRVLPREKPADLAVPAASGERIDLSALADLGARAEAISRALATRQRGAGGGGGGGGAGGEIAGGTTATRLFSRDISDDPRMRTAMNGMPQAARVDLLCMTELRAQLRAGTPPYHADLLPSFRLEAGNVLQPRRAAFRAGGQWYDLDFRCELNAGVTRVESFSHRVGEPVPRSEWSARRFPGGN